MTRHKTFASLMRFIRLTCANFDRRYGYCYCLDDSGLADGAPRPVQDNERCMIQQGSPCEYFERILLPIARQHRVYEQVFEQYSKLDKDAKRETVRRCPDCGAELWPRRRYCDFCRDKRRRKTVRQNVRRHRKKTGRT